MKDRVWIIVCMILIFPFTVTASAQEEQPIRIIIWHAFGGDTLPYLDRMLADFNQTHLGIIAEAAPQGSYEDTFSALENRVTEAANFQPPADNPEASAPSVPHLVHVSTIDVERAQDSGLFVPLADIPGGYYDALLQNYSLGGSQYGIPWNTALPVLYANADLLAGAGISELPTSLAAFTQACQSLSGGCATWPIDAWLIRNWTDGVPLESPVFSNFAAWWAEMNASGYYVSNRRLADWDDALNRFVNGEVAFLIASTADTQHIRQQTNFAIQNGPLPGAPGNFTPIGGSLWIMAGHSPEEQAAAQTLLIWLTNTENAVRWHKGTGFLPTRPQAYDVLTEQAWPQAHPALAVAEDMLVNQQNIAVVDRREVSQILEEGLLRIIGGTAVDREVSNMIDRITRATGE